MKTGESVASLAVPASNFVVPTYSFVLPAFNECENVRPMTARLLLAAKQLDGPVEVVWVDDGSTDGTAEAMDWLASEYGNVRVVHLARNFGHMAALTAGLEHAHGSGAIITLDADGQHPPELIAEFVARWRGGAEIVQAIRLPDKDTPTFKHATSRGFYAVMRWLSGMDLPDGAADFRLLDRQVVDTINRLPERERFLRAIVYWVGFRRETVTYTPARRAGGTTKYTGARMLLLALSGLTSFSTRPLRLAFLLGTLVSLAAMCYAVFILICFCIGIPLVPGWTSMLLVSLTLGGVQLLALGIASEYLPRIFVEQKNRPVYIVRNKP